MLPILHTVPEAIRAQRHHYNLVRRHSQRAVSNTMGEAIYVCFRWWDSNRFDRRWRQRMTALNGPKWHAFKDYIELVACTYPNIAALAGLPRLTPLAVPYPSPARAETCGDSSGKFATEPPPAMTSKPPASATRWPAGS